MSNGKTLTIEERERIWSDQTVDLIRCLDKINQLARVCLLCDSERAFLREAIWHMGYKSWDNAFKTYRKLVQGGAK